MLLAPLKFRLYDHNIRYDNRTGRDEGEKYWEDRKVSVIASIKFNTQYTSVVTLQEVFHNQLQDIVAGLGEEWTYFGVGREDGDTKGEYAPILYRKTEWTLEESWTKWLSETPDVVGSRGWDAVLPRIVSYAKLKHAVTGRVVGVFNTHYDHAGVRAREESSKLIIQWMQDALASHPVALAGDFNSEPTDIAYKTLSKQLIDSSTVLGAKTNYGHTHTFSGFQGHEAGYIDFIWLPPTGVKLQAFGILHSEFHGWYMSDHRPIAADLVI